ncbi:phage tail protein [bacterium]|nr:phage tail protein [bacterium]
MNDAFPKDARDRIALRFWQDEGELHRTGEVIDRFFDAFQNRLRLVLCSVDAETCSGELLDLLAFQRDVDRLPGEPDAMFRKRVQFAAANARDAGSLAGFRRIWERLGLGTIEQIERFDPVNWDVVKLRIDEQVFAEIEQFLDMLIQMYGRACRRYHTESVALASFGLMGFEYAGDYFYAKAIL